MGERASYENGTFNWVELGTDDPAAAGEFYSELFGWEGEKLEGGHGDYTLFRLGGKKVAAVLQRGEKQPVNAWNSYIAVDDVDATAARAAELGGTVAAGPFDIPGVARMAFVLDPTGAAVGLWEAGGGIGAELVNDAGRFSMNQLNTSDPEVAGAFFAELFGWRVIEVPSDLDPYWALVPGRGGGVDERRHDAAARRRGPVPLDRLLHGRGHRRSIAKVKELGGSVLVEPIGDSHGRPRSRSPQIPPAPRSRSSRATSTLSARLCLAPWPSRHSNARSTSASARHARD